jgi:hypothetical protein
MFQMKKGGIIRPVAYQPHVLFHHFEVIGVVN